MTHSPVLGVIPARLGSERLPRKPLQLLAGRPLIEWVWRNARRIGTFDAIVVATDSEEIASACRGFGAEVEMTSADHPSGTDRVAEVATRRRFRGYDVIVNVQGDEPFLEADHVARAVELVRGGWDVGTVATPVRTVDAWRDPAVVKVVRSEDGGALYFSRAPIPFVRDGEPPETDLASAAFLRHVGLYSYSRDALLRWVALPVGELERRERLEQLRPLAAGISIGVAVVESAAPGVDTPADAAWAETRIRSDHPTDAVESMSA
ncbi:MAG TPA: 3-deoxy-manno-octulosonate cytidylyltransferase [Longimicrobiales bacterium]|nr:3-deoxy-manno-octulosonate cytidylyltransferase [Longimicrobiales bacterium]